MPELRDLTGTKFGEWTVINRAEDHVQPKGYHITMWHCICSCGTERDVYANSLLTGRSKSCGCQGSKASAEFCKNHFTIHGETKTRLYQIWAGMRKRCYNSNASNYKDYGGRGIKVCNEWNDYAMFRDWAIEHGYADNLSIDRIDVNGDYTPDNCRWVNCVTQNNNRRSNKYYEFNGESHTVAEWARIVGKSYKVTWKRIHNGKTFEELLT